LIQNHLKRIWNFIFKHNLMFMNRFLKVIYFLALFFVIISALALAGQYKVIRVVDGDTIVIRYNGKYKKSVFSVNMMLNFVLPKNVLGKRN